MTKIPDIQKEVVLARIQYQGIFSENEKYLALEDFKYLYDYTSRNNIGEYLMKNKVKYLIVDETFKDYKFNKELQLFLSSHAKPIANISNQTLATRSYDDVPFHWPYATIFKKKNIYKVLVYQIK
jgi:hypothetical protein